MKYKHSKSFAELKAIHEDIQINLTSLQYLQILDYYLYNAVFYLHKISPNFLNQFIAKVIAYQQIHSMSKVSSESREKVSCMFFNYITTNDRANLKQLYLNRGLYFGLINYWLNKNRLYFKGQSILEDLPQIELSSEIDITNKEMHFAYFKCVEYWFNLALDFKAKIVQKYTRMTLLQAQKTYVEYNHLMDLDDVTQIYLQVMSKAIDRCDSRFGVLTTFIQSWLKSAKAIVQKTTASMIETASVEELSEQFGDSAFGSISSEDSQTNLLHDLMYYASIYDSTGCLRIKYHIPQYLSPAQIDLLNSYAK